MKEADSDPHLSPDLWLVKGCCFPQWSSESRVTDSEPRLNNLHRNRCLFLQCSLTLSMERSRSPTFPSWSLQRMISRSPGRISALLMPTSAPVTGRTIPPTPELEDSATCCREGRGGWRERWEKERIQEACSIKIQPQIKSIKQRHVGRSNFMKSETLPLWST